MAFHSRQSDDTEVDEQQYFLTGYTGVIILTSSNSEYYQYAIRAGIPLDGINQPEACELLLKATRASRSLYEVHQHDIKLVATSLLKGAL